jgi:hypothetical protein
MASNRISRTPRSSSFSSRPRYYIEQFQRHEAPGRKIGRLCFDLHADAGLSDEKPIAIRLAINARRRPREKWPSLPYRESRSIARSSMGSRPARESAFEIQTGKSGAIPIPSTVCLLGVKNICLGILYDQPLGSSRKIGDAAPPAVVSPTVIVRGRILNPLVNHSEALAL